MTPYKKTIDKIIEEISIKCTNFNTWYIDKGGCISVAKAGFFMIEIYGIYRMIEGTIQKDHSDFGEGVVFYGLSKLLGNYIIKKK